MYPYSKDAIKGKLYTALKPINQTDEMSFTLVKF